jgi:putative DNA primase/helicase
MTRAAPQLNEADIIDKFRDAMAKMGLRTADKLIADGDINRFHIEGDPPRTKNGWYVLHLDGIAAGAFGCWKRGVDATWCSKSEAELTSAERAEMQARIERAKRERDQRRDAMQRAVAVEAARLWDASPECDTHPYLTRKAVKSYGLRVGEWMNGNQALLVPVMEDFFRLVSLQAIFPNINPAIGRDKDFMAGGKKAGCCFTIGQPPAVSDTNAIIQLGEGYATCADGYDATGHFTVIAFDAGNLKAVAHAIRRKWPAATILLLADNDRWTVPTEENPHIVENPGVTFARQTQEAIPARVFVAVPEFASLDDKPTDFNDLKNREGLDEVRRQLLAALPVEKQPANDNEPDAPLPLDAAVTPFGWPHVSDKGQPLNTWENLEWMLGEYGITSRYNETRKQVEVAIPGRTFSIDNRANCSLAELTSLCARNRMPQSMLADYVKLISDRNAFNPVRDWINSKPWDGTSRLQALFDTVKVDGDTAMRDMLMYRWMLSAVAAVFMLRGFESHGVLVFTGEQGQGKTKWVKRLVPIDLDVVMVGAVLDPNNKDHVINATSHWLVELGELDATFRKADIARLKSFITNGVDKVRRPYDRIESEYQRRTVFFASVNESKYLVDDTGNRRWWTIAAIGVDYEHDIDVQQVWAELLTHFQRGERWYLTREEQQQLNELNATHEAVDPIEEQILTAFEWDKPALVPNEMTATEVLISIGYDKPTKQQATHASKVLKKLTGVKEPKKKNSGRYFPMPRQMRRSTQQYHQDDNDRPL